MKGWGCPVVCRATGIHKRRGQVCAAHGPCSRRITRMLQPEPCTPPPVLS